MSANLLLFILTAGISLFGFAIVFSLRNAMQSPTDEDAGGKPKTKHSKPTIPPRKAQSGGAELN